jgi:hypothetical protein
MIDDDDECGTISGMRIGRRNRSAQRKPAQYHFVHHKSHMTDLGSNPDRRAGKAATNRLSYGTAYLQLISQVKVKVTFRLTVSQSLYLGVGPRLRLMTRYFFLFESFCPVHVVRPL